jgi:RHS repeat-associated protein
MLAKKLIGNRSYNSGRRNGTLSSWHFRHGNKAFKGRWLTIQCFGLYTPHGAARYSSGTMPTSYGYTKMRQDPSGLSYDNARYYDASVGQFISADLKQGPNRYGYVGGNPETNIDPTGNGFCSAAGSCQTGGRATPPPPPPTPQHRPTTPTKPITSTSGSSSSYTHICDGCKTVHTDNFQQMGWPLLSTLYLIGTGATAVTTFLLGYIKQ